MFTAMRPCYFLALALTVTPAEGLGAAFLAINVQQCFLPDGAVPVSESDAIVPVLNNIRQRYSRYIHMFVLVQDWHCPDHVSFASQHPGYSPQDYVELTYDGQGRLCKNANITGEYAVKCPTVVYRLLQRLWPDHCIMNTADANFTSTLIVRDSDYIVYKGNNCAIDSYSVFFDNFRFKATNLDALLKQNQIKSVYLAGLTTEYGINWTAHDAQALGYETYVILDAIRSSSPEAAAMAISDMVQSGINTITSSDMESTFTFNNSKGPLPSEILRFAIYLSVGKLMFN